MQKIKMLANYPKMIPDKSQIQVIKKSKAVNVRKTLISLKIFIL